MPTFKYQAKKSSGENISGIIEASSIDSASDMLKDKNYVIISIVEKAFSSYNTDKIMSIFNRVTSKDIVFFARQLSVMLEASVPVVKSLRVLIKQTNNPVFQTIISNVASDVDGGAKLSAALGRYNKVFNNFFVHMARAGETTGRLDKSLVYLADQIEKEYTLRSRIRGAMVYPAFIIGVLVIMGFLMMIFVVPKFVDIFETSDIELPMATKILIGTSNFFVSYWWLLILLIIGAVFAVIAISKTKNGHYYMDSLKIKVPMIGPINWKTAMVRFSRSLSSLLSSGVPVTKSLRISADIVSNDVYREILKEAASEVEVGNSISSTLIKHKQVPLLITHMINIGEETGRLDKVLLKVADFYESETNTSIKSLISLIEPIILVLMAVVAGGVVLSVLMPMYKLTESFT